MTYQFVDEPRYREGIVWCEPHIEWETAQGSFTVLPKVSVCDKKKDGTPCKKGWVDISLITDLLVQAMTMSELRQRCMELNRQIDHAYSYRVDYITKYVCVKRNNTKQHLVLQDVPFSHEIGQSGMTPTAVVAILKKLCVNLQKELNMRVHHIIAMRVQMRKGSVAVGGCPSLLERYKTICHPAVCVCENNRPVGNLCHHWFMDTLLGGNMDLKTGHPFAVFPNGRVTNFRSLLHTVVRVVDDVVWGGILGRTGVALHLDDDLMPSTNYGETRCVKGRIEICINTALCARPKAMGQTVLHECAHARMLLDKPGFLGEPHHGADWLQRMMDIRKLLAYRLSEDAQVASTRHT